MSRGSGRTDTGLSAAAAGGVASAAAGLAAADVWLMVSARVMGVDAMTPFRHIAGALTGQVWFGRGEPALAAAGIGVTMHALSMLLLGALYGVASRGMTSRGALWCGALYGVGIWIAIQYALLPIMGTMFPQPLNPFVLAVSMLYYGLFLGYGGSLRARRRQ